MTPTSESVASCATPDCERAVEPLPDRTKCCISCTNQPGLQDVHLAWCRARNAPEEGKKATAAAWWLDSDGLDTCPCHPTPPPRPCKYDGAPIVYEPREDVWTRRGLHQYGSHTGSCGRKLVLMRITPGSPPGRKR